MTPPQTPAATVPSHMPSMAARRRRWTEFTAAQIGVLFIALVLIAAIPIFTHPLPPLEDYINHLARMHVIATVNSDPDLAKFYEIDWQILPNLMMDVIVPHLAHFMSIYAAGQVFTIMTFMLILSGVLVLNRALFRSWSILPLVAAPLLYNYVFLIGVMNYMFGIGLALWGLAFWVLLRERMWPARLVVSTIFVLALFFCHLFAVGLYGMGLLSFELMRLWSLRDRPLLPRLIDFCAAGLPFVPVLPLLLMSPTWELSGENSWEQRGKIDGLIYIIEVYSDFVAFALTAIVIAAIVWAVRRKILTMHPVGLMLIVIGGLIYLAMPRVMFATYMADQRLPIAIAFMVVACAHLELRNRLVRRGFIALLLIMLVVRVIEVDVTWADLSRATLDFRDSAKRIKRGSTVLVAYGDRSGGDDVRELGLVHAACLAMIERSALVTTAFAVRGKQILNVKAPYNERVDIEDGTPPSIEQLLVAVDRDDETPKPPYWQDWPAQFEYVYLLFTEQDAPNPAPELLSLVHEGPHFQLYKVIKQNNAAR